MNRSIEFLKYFDPITTPRNVVKRYYRQYQEEKKKDKTLFLRYTTRIGEDRYINKLRVIKIIGCKCEACGVTYLRTLEIHHVGLVSEGGTDDIENLAVLCEGCHSLVHYAIDYRDLHKIKGSVPEKQYRKLEMFVNKRRGQ